MSSLYSEYIKEREGKECIETNKGFLTYAIFPEHIYIENLYVRPEFRKSHEATRMADEVCSIAKEKGLKYILGSVAPSAHGSTDSCKALLSYGFCLLRSDINMIWFIKEIS